MFGRATIGGRLKRFQRRRISSDACMLSVVEVLLASQYADTKKGGPSQGRPMYPNGAFQDRIKSLINKAFIRTLAQRVVYLRQQPALDYAAF